MRQKWRLLSAGACRSPLLKGSGSVHLILEDALQGGTHYEAAMRRAALMNTDDEESEGEEQSEASENEPEEDLQAKIDALSDDEAKEELKEAQLRRLMEDSQVLAQDCYLLCILGAGTFNFTS